MLSIEKCREILGADAPASEEDLEATRERAYQMARILIELEKIRRQKRPSGRRVP